MSLLPSCLMQMVKTWPILQLIIACLQPVFQPGTKSAISSVRDGETDVYIEFDLIIN